ncbi:class I adenylate-forming enzyme family protein [Marinoscillum sp. MHG1-6]|uniref:class I adenylate-forming enzyme family protein n=1 Tax=Marinoscillum sp. MHG1-6 TaxID=2959627 RepID=UPI0021582AFA|nr:AMP-binding protein [Marinoscillum sp. MHG1-6]
MYRKDWISKWAQLTPHNVAVEECETGRSLTYMECNERAENLSGHLIQNYELKTGDRVMVLAEHALEYVILFSMMQKTGITLVPINYRLANSEINYLIQNCNPTLFISEHKFQEKVNDLEINVTITWFEDLAKMSKTKPTFPYSPVETSEDHPAFILYTSGSTGFPKGAIYSHKMLFWNSINTSQSLEITTEDHTINCMPPFHTGGWNVLLTPLLHRGATVALMKKFDPEQLLRLIDQKQSKLFMGVPTMLKMMADCSLFHASSLASLRYFVVGGEALPLDVIRKWHQKGVKIRQGYGLTEVGPNITSLHQDDAESKIGSIGHANFYVDYKIVNEKGERVGSNEIGEFWLKGPMVTPGYWQDQKATDAAITDGWFHTGDLVREDDDGYLYVVDRKKSMFISGGENVYPAEVERVLRTFPSVDEAAVVAVPDQKWGEVGKAYITIRPGQECQVDQIRQFCMDHLAKFKVPRYFEFIPEMPKNGSGKIDRKLLTKK